MGKLFWRSSVVYSVIVWKPAINIHTVYGWLGLFYCLFCNIRAEYYDMFYQQNVSCQSMAIAFILNCDHYSTRIQLWCNRSTSAWTRLTHCVGCLHPACVMVGTHIGSGATCELLRERQNIPRKIPEMAIKRNFICWLFNSFISCLELFISLLTDQQC